MNKIGNFSISLKDGKDAVKVITQLIELGYTRNPLCNAGYDTVEATWQHGQVIRSDRPNIGNFFLSGFRADVAYFGDDPEGQYLFNGPHFETMEDFLEAHKRANVYH